MTMTTTNDDLAARIVGRLDHEIADLAARDAELCAADLYNEERDRRTGRIEGLERARAIVYAVTTGEAPDW